MGVNQQVGAIFWGVEAARLTNRESPDPGPHAHDGRPAPADPFPALLFSTSHQPFRSVVPQPPSPFFLHGRRPLARRERGRRRL